jgi:hypothetical protein
VRPGALDRLLHYGLVRESRQGERRYRAWSEHFQAYLERCARDTPAWQTWAETERALRNFIDDVCRGRHGDRWLDVLAGRHRSVADLVRDGEQLMAKERHNFGPAASDRLLDFTYPMSLWGLITAEWALFEPLLGKSKAHWNERFTKLAQVRAPAAHNREVPEADLLIAQGYCKELLAVLRAVPSTERA